jgi:hypothetical protein
MYHKIQIKFEYGEIDIYRSWIMALFLLEDRDFKGFWMKIKVTLNQIFSNFNTICISTLIFLETLHQLLHQFTFLSIPSLQVCFHHMSYNQCFDVNSERKKEMITGNLI